MNSGGVAFFLIRFFDIFFSVIGLIFGMPLLFLLAIAGLFDTGLPFFFQRRVGRNQEPFTLIKFRTMQPGTVSIATHLADPLQITALGRFLRHTKLDELPQLWNVLMGDMSLVGPRPCLFNQEELVNERAKLGVFKTKPGVTGLAQIKGIDMSTPKLLAETDAIMIKNMTVTKYFYYILETMLGKGAGDRTRESR